MRNPMRHAAGVAAVATLAATLVPGAAAAQRIVGGSAPYGGALRGHPGVAGTPVSRPGPSSRFGQLPAPAGPSSRFGQLPAPGGWSGVGWSTGGWGTSGWSTGGRPPRRARPIARTVVVGPWLGYYAGPVLPYADAAASGAVVDAPAPRVPRTEVVEASPAPADAAAVRAEPLDGGALLRLRWAGRDASAREVTLVVADTARRIVAAQTVREAPFTAVFDRAGRVAFVGATVVRADGVSTTTLVPLGLATARTR